MDTASEQPAIPEVGGRGEVIGETVSHYTILEKLGEGGMGIVYKAHDNKLKRDVALKFLPAEMTSDETAKMRFIHEAQAASALDHPNIAVVHEVGETKDGRSFICMAYYRGETLREKIQQGPMEASESAGIAIQVAQGLERAHGAGIIHRDIKPANILVTSDGVVKIVDFGLAKLSSDTRSSKSGRMAGTAAYMSPEQIRGQQADRRADLFSLGVVLYEMVTGSRPFEGMHEAAIFYSILHSDPVAPSKIVKGVSPALEGVITRSLQKEPAMRYQQASEMAADLRAFESGFLPATGIRHALRAVTSRKIPAAIALAVLACLAGWLTLSRLARPSFRFEPSRYVLVTDFENGTGDSVFNHSLTEAIKVSLRQSPHLNLFPSDRIPDGLQRMALPGDHRLDEATSLELARREGAQVIVAGSIQPVGSGFALTCRIVNASSGESLDQLHRQAARVENVLSEMDELCKDIRRRLGETLEEISNNAPPLERVTTPSLQALESHSRAMRLEAQGNYHDAALLEEQAVSADPRFAMATSELSYDLRKLGRDSLALAYHDRVPSLVGRVSDRERSTILAVYYGPSFELDFPKAYSNIQQLVVRYPNNAEGFSILGWLAMYEGDTRAAIRSFQQSLALDSVTYTGTIYNNWGYTLALAGDGEHALDFYKKSKAIRPAYYAIDVYMAEALWMRGLLDSAEEALRSVLQLTEGQQRISVSMQLASLCEFQGKLRSAQAECVEGLDLCKKYGRPMDEAYFHFLLAELAAASSQAGVYTREMTLAERLCSSPFFELPLIGQSFARNGRLVDARRIFDRILSTTSPDPYFRKRQKDFAHLVKGEILLQSQSPSEALGEFSNVERIHSGDPIFLLAQLGIARSHEVRGDTSAIVAYKSILEHRGEAVMAFVRSIRTGGFWTRQLWPEIDLALGKLLIRHHDRDRATQHLTDCLQCWHSADGSDEHAREATKILAQLTKGH